MNWKLITQTSLALICIVLYSANTLTFPTQESQKFSEWLSGVSPTLTGQEYANNPEIKVILRSNLENFKGNWEVYIPEKSDDRSVLDRGLRLLELIKVSSALSPGSATGKIPDITLQIISESQNFSSTITRDELKKNISLQTLLKLITIYSEPTQTADTTKEDSNA